MLGKTPNSINKLHPSLHILLQPSVFHTFRYPPTKEIPREIYTTPKYTFVNITKTSDELSVVLGYRDDPSLPLPLPGEGERIVINKVEEFGEELAGRWTGPWRCFKVRGPMYLNMVGIMNELTKPLRAAAIPVFAISTWDTDYLLVPAEKVEQTEKALETDGWNVITVGNDGGRHQLTSH